MQLGSGSTKFMKVVVQFGFGKQLGSLKAIKLAVTKYRTLEFNLETQ